MKCLNCNAPLGNINFCPECGADMSILKRVERISNLNYNEGLDKASVRDLSGAIVCLKRSLKFNKYNIKARNLLGLVYYETGEVVSALSEWVISKNLHAENNIADEYIKKLQANPNKLNTINQTIKKYNQSLIYCQEGSEDMAIIQLKKILIQNPQFIKGYQLLALIYLKDEKYEKARKILKKAARIDNTNTITLRYVRVVDEATRTKTSLEERSGKRREKDSRIRRDGTIYYVSDNETIIQPTTFQESSIIATFINLIIGMVVGAAVVYCLIVPDKKQEVSNQANVEIAQYGERISALQVTVDSIQSQLDSSNALIEQANTNASKANAIAASYTDLIKAAAAIESEATADKDSAVVLLAAVDRASLDSAGQVLYDNVKVKVDSHNLTALEAKADTLFASQDYAGTITALEEARISGEITDASLEKLAKSYYNTQDVAKSNAAFHELITRVPSRTVEWETYLQKGLQVGLQE